MSNLKKVILITAHLMVGLIAVAIAPTLAKSGIVSALNLAVIFDEEQVRAVAGGIDILLMIIAYFVFVKYYEKRAVEELTLKTRPILSGACAGALMIGLPILLLFGLGYYQVVTYQGLGAMPLAITGLTANAIAEEFIFRGVLLRILETHIGTLYAVLVVITLYTGATVAASDSISTLGVINLVMISAVWCGIYIISRNIWVVALHHAAWNYTEFASGILDEHWRVNAPVTSVANGPAPLTGGSAGPEASILTTVIIAFALYYIYRVLKQRAAGQS